MEIDIITYIFGLILSFLFGIVFSKLIDMIWQNQGVKKV